MSYDLKVRDKLLEITQKTIELYEALLKHKSEHEDWVEQNWEEIENIQDIDPEFWILEDKLEELSYKVDLL